MLARHRGRCLAVADRGAARRRREEAAKALPFAPGAALVFVFLAYGGWSDTATLSARCASAPWHHARAAAQHESRHAALRAHDSAYLRGLSHVGLARSEASAADLLCTRRRAGADADRRDRRANSVASINAIIIARTRTTYAAARHTASLAHLRGSHVAHGTPRAAIVATTSVALALVGFGAYTRRGFATMTIPVAGLLAVLTSSGFAFLVLRRRYPEARIRFACPGTLGAARLHRQQCVRAVLEFAYVRVGAVAGVAVLTAVSPCSRLCGSVLKCQRL